MMMKVGNGGRLGKALMLGMLLVGRAGAANLPDYQWPVEPTSGMYFDPTQPGNGLGVELLPVNGQPFFFGAFYHYSPDGAPTWFTFQSFMHQASLAEYATNGVVATIDGPWIVSNSGQCFDCAYTAPSTVATPFQRQITVIGARHLQMAASGNAAALNMQRSEAVIAAGGPALSEALLMDSNTVWAVTSRTRFTSILHVKGQGWVRFRRRPANEPHVLFSGFVSAPGESEPNTVPPPAWLVVNGDPNTLPQYEAVCVLSDFSTVGECSSLSSGFAIGNGDSALRKTHTWLIDPVTGRIRIYTRCDLGTSCNIFSPTTIKIVADVIEGVPARAGEPPRLLVRRFDMHNNSWFQEAEFRPLSAAELAEKFPNGVPAP